MVGVIPPGTALANGVRAGRAVLPMTDVTGPLLILDGNSQLKVVAFGGGRIWDSV